MIRPNGIDLLLLSDVDPLIVAAGRRFASVPTLGNGLLHQGSIASAHLHLVFV